MPSILVGHSPCCTYCQISFVFLKLWLKIHSIKFTILTQFHRIKCRLLKLCRWLSQAQTSLLNSRLTFSLASYCLDIPQIFQTHPRLKIIIIIFWKSIPFTVFLILVNGAAIHQLRNQGVLLALSLLLATKQSITKSMILQAR